MTSNFKFYFLILILFSLNGFSQKKSKSIELLDAELSQFEKWNGVPHTTVTDLPEGTYQSDNVHSGTALGLNNDIKDVFTASDENGEIVLKITGEIYGGLTTINEYENYHLSTMFKWGEIKWEPRLDAKRDSGILYHCYGEHGSFWKTWKTCLEYQVQENDLGDFIPLNGNSAEPKVDGPIVDIRGDFTNEKKFDPNSDVYSKGIGYIQASSEHDAPHGEWNHLEIYVVGNNAIHLVNGEIVMVVENAKKPDGTLLTKGQIQIQSEAAECYYKNLVLTPIKKFPRAIKKQVRFK